MTPCSARRHHAEQDEPSAANERIRERANKVTIAKAREVLPSRAPTGGTWP